MSSSYDTVKASRVLRDGEASTKPAPVLVDLDSLTGAARRAVNPAVVLEAQSRGYADGRAAGHRDGYRDGREEALAEARRLGAAHAAAVDAGLAALARAAAELAEHQHRTLAGVEDTLVAGAFELAAAVVGREVEVAVSPGRDAVARALSLATGLGPMVARLHPDDVATLGEHADLAPGRHLTVVADPAVERGGCLLEVGDGHVDAQLGPALARVRELLAS